MMFVMAGLFLGLILLVAGEPGIAGGAVLAGVFIQSIPGKYVIGVGQRSTHGRARARRQARRDDDEYIRQVAIDIGLEDYTAAELKRFEAEDAAVHNKHARDQSAFNNPQGTWIDYHGNVRDWETNQVIHYARRK